MSPTDLPETGPGSSGRGASRWLVGLCAATLLSVPAVQHWVELRDGRLPRCYELLRMLPGPRELAALRGIGDLGDLLPRAPELLAYERALEQESVLPGALRPRLQSALAFGLGIGGETARIGREGWLFYGPALIHVGAPGFLEGRALARRVRDTAVSERPPEPDPLPAIVDFRDQLASRGIELVLVPVPPKAAIHPERWSRRCEAVAAPLYNPSFALFADRLEAVGVRLFDPSEALWELRRGGEDAFLATDSHWTPRGAEAAARALADFLGDALPPSQLAAPVRAAAIRRVANTGDVATMLGLPRSRQDALRERVDIRPVVAAGGEPWRPEREAEVLVLGDSYSNIYSQAELGWGEAAGFVEQLSVALGRPLDAIRRNAGGALATRRALADAAARGDDRLAGKGVVIYQFAMRELSWGDWRPVDLGAAAPRPGALSAPGGGPVAGDASITVSGRIAATSGAPPPGSTPYPDCVISVHLDSLRVEAGALPDTELVVYLWGLRDHRSTAAAAYRAGERVRLRLTPWQQLEPRLGRHRRVELDDPESRRLTPYWAEEPSSAPLSAALSESARVPPAAPSDAAARPFLATLGRRAADATERGASVVRGSEDWLFLTSELRHLGAGPFWGAAAAGADPLPVIVDFQRQLAGAGIELLLVPVPPKSILFPGAALAAPADSLPAQAPRLDPHHQAFYAALRTRGVEVLDLVPAFREARAAGGELYCRQDSHWSGAAARIAARRIAEELQDRRWLAEIEPEQLAVEEGLVEIEGDLARGIDGDLGSERLRLWFVGRRRGERLEPVAPSEQSPLLVLADSHGLVFHAGGEMHAASAGLPDHLAFQLGHPVDLIAVLGSGVNAPRVTLARHPERLRGKRCVIWLFSAAAFSESFDGWQSIEVLP